MIQSSGTERKWLTDFKPPTVLVGPYWVIKGDRIVTSSRRLNRHRKPTPGGAPTSLLTTIARIVTRVIDINPPRFLTLPGANLHCLYPLNFAGITRVMILLAVSVISIPAPAQMKHDHAAVFTTTSQPAGKAHPHGCGSETAGCSGLPSLSFLTPSIVTRHSS
jgi:hypothetical protein